MGKKHSTTWEPESPRWEKPHQHDSSTIGGCRRIGFAAPCDWRVGESSSTLGHSLWSVRFEMSHKTCRVKRDLRGPPRLLAAFASEKRLVRLGSTASAEGSSEILDASCLGDGVVQEALRSVETKELPHIGGTTWKGHLFACSQLRRIRILLIKIADLFTRRLRHW